MDNMAVIIRNQSFKEKTIINTNYCETKNKPVNINNNSHQNSNQNIINDHKK